jgi:hypothetical protein
MAGDLPLEMKRTAMLLLVLAAVAAATDALAQRPDFSGTWVRADSVSERASVASVGDAAFQRGAMGDGWGSPLTLRQSADTLVVEYVHFARYDLQPPLRLVYSLSGSESRNAIMIGHADTRLTSRTAWSDSALVITTHFSVPGNTAETIEVRQVLALQSADTLVVETTRPGAAGSPPLVTRVVYAKR